MDSLEGAGSEVRQILRSSGDGAMVTERQTPVKRRGHGNSRPAGRPATAGERSGAEVGLAGGACCGAGQGYALRMPMDDDLDWRRFRAYARRRVAARATVIAGPVVAVLFVLITVVPTVAYGAGDVRGDLAWRLLVSAAFLVFSGALVAYAGRWLLADRRGEKRPPRAMGS